MFRSEEDANKYSIELLNDRFTRKNLEEMSLEMAEKCFHNALIILQNILSEYRTKYSVQEPFQPLGTNNELVNQSYSKLQHALINVTLKLAYVSLCLDNPLLSLTHCKTILSLSVAYSNLTSCPVQYTIMALSYAFEALTMTDQSEKVFQIITPQQLQTLISHLQQFHSESEGELYQQILLLNLSIVHLIQGNYEKSQQTLNHISQNIHQLPNQIKPYFFCVQIYLLMIEGKSQQALDLISTIKIK